MKNLNKQIRKIALLTFVVCTISFNVNAQLTATSSSSSSSSSFEGCSQTIKYKTGVVYSVSPGILQKRATSNSVTVKVKKTSGRAETQVNIYVNGQFKKKIEFDNGNYNTQYRTRTLNNVRGKTIKVEIVNQSAANTFGYTARIIGKRKSVTQDGKAINGSLPVGQMKKTFETVASCTNKTNVKITLKRRTIYNARGTVRVYKKSGNGWTRILSETIEANQSNWNHTFNTNKKLKIELKNISVGNRMDYKMNALVVQ